jgi:transcription antitermination factor NusG
MRVPYYEGDQALITSGPLAGRIGKVMKVDETTDMVTLVMDIFDRETLVDVDFARLVDPDAVDTAVGDQ